jgi:mycofactocin system glycosyltransferase
MSATLPRGFRVRLADDVVALADGTVLVGGSPLTSLRIADPARGLGDGRRLTVTDQGSARIADRLLATNLAQPELTATPIPSPRELTVVVPVRDRPDQLDRCLASLAGLDCIVVDDASLEPRAVAHITRRHGATLVPLDHNVGPAAARNVGLARVATAYVAFVDSDVEVRPEDLLALLRHFADPAVVLAGPRVVGRTSTGRPRWFERYESRDSSLTLGTRSGVVRAGAGVAWLPSACLVGRTASLGDGFDALMRVGEDVDLVWRLTDAGHRVRYDADVEARHETRSTVRGWLGRKAFYGSGSASLAVRHGSHVAPAVLSPAYAVAAAATLSRHRFAPPLAAVALLRGRRAVAGVLPAESTGTQVESIALRGFGWALRQESALLLRHWWPATLIAALVSRRVRRAVVTALLVDLVVVLKDTEALPLADLPAHLAARRLDDLAYGAGLWWGVLRTGRPGALAPRWTRSRRSRSRPTWP